MHASHIRDNLAPMLAHNPVLDASERTILEQALAKIGHTKMKLDLLRFSHMEKALMLITDGTLAWPTDIVDQAKELLERWEVKWGSLLYDLRANLFMPGARMEGLRESVSRSNGMAVDNDQDDASSHRLGHFSA